MLRRLNCRVCGETIPGGDIDHTNGIAVCHNCGTVIRLNDDKPKRSIDDWGGNKRKNERALGYGAQPEGVDTIEDHEGLLITLLHPAIYGVGMVNGVILVVFAVVFIGIFFLTIPINISTDSFRFIFPGSLFVLVMLGIPLFMVYSGLVAIMNRVEVRADQTRIWTRPLPLYTFNRSDVAVTDILQIYTRDRLHRNKNRTWKTYEVRAVLQGGRHVNIVTSLSHADVALYIEEVLEDYLNLTDVSVPGELRRRY